MLKSRLREKAICISSKLDPNLPPLLSGQLVQMLSLTQEQKLAIFRFHSGDPDFSESDLLEPFETAHDLMIAAKTRSTLTRSATRVDLYDGYVAQCLPSLHSTVAGALCRHIASTMSRDFSSVMSRHDFEKEAQIFVENAGGTLQIVDDVRHTRLVKPSVTDFSFTHELIQEHLHADWLCREHENFQALLAELQKPAHRHLARAVLSRQKVAAKARAILQVISDTELYVHVFYGRCGEIARQVLLQDSKALLCEAAADLPKIVVKFEIHFTGDRSMVLGWPEMENCREWSVYESSLAGLIGKTLDNAVFAEPVADLLAISGASIQQAAASAVEGTGVNERTAFDHVLHRYLQAQDSGSMKCPALMIFQNWRSSIFRSRSEIHLGGAWASALWSQASQQSIGAQAFVAFALCELYEWAEKQSEELLERVFRLAWELRLGTLRMNALEMLTTAARCDASGSIRHSERIRKLLEAADAATSNQNIFMNTFMVDAMSEYGMIPPPVEAEAAAAEMRGLINPASDYARSQVEIFQTALPEDSCNPLAEAACRILGMFFEDVFQSVYCVAFNTLTGNEQTAFLNLAAQAKDPTFHLWYIMVNLVKSASPSSVPVFQRFAAGISPDSGSWQETMYSFLLAVVGCAKTSADLPPWKMERNAANEALRILREILYQHFKGTSTSAAIDELWLSLRAEAPLGAADALFVMNRSCVYESRGSEFTANIADHYPDHVRAIMEYSLANLTKLTSAWKFGQNGHHARERAEFVISALGRVGKHGNIEALKMLADDPALGEHTIAAIKSIRSRQS